MFFYIFYGFTGYDIIFFFLIFVILFIFVKRYGLIITFMLLTLTFGSNAIELVVKPVTGIIYPVLILVFAFLGFISSLFFSFGFITGTFLGGFLAYFVSLKVSLIVFYP